MSSGARHAQHQHQPHGRRGPRTPWAVLGIVALIALVAAALTWFLRSRDAPPAADPSGSPSASASASAKELQRTLLLQVRDGDLVAVDNVLLGAGGGPDRGVFLYSPAGLLVDVPGAGTLPLGETARLPDTLASVDAMSDLLGVRIDGGFVLDRLAFAGLVDAAGGVPVDVKKTMVIPGPDGKAVLTIPKGAQTLDGIAASYYVTTLLPGEKEGARIARFSDVFVKVLADLPDDPERMRQVVTSLGALARSTVPNEELATTLLTLQAEVKAQRAVQETLPSTLVRAGEDQIYLLDQRKADALVRKLLPEAVLAPGQGKRVRVLVQNGVGTPGLGASARDQLVDAGFAYVNGGNASSFGNATTLVIVPDDSPESRERGVGVARALGVPESSLRVAAAGQSIADVVVVLGADFVPTATPTATPPTLPPSPSITPKPSRPSTTAKPTKPAKPTSSARSSATGS